MGETLAVSAVRGRSVGEVVQGICTLTAGVGIVAEVFDGSEADPAQDTIVSPAPKGWTIVAWPASVLLDERFYRELSRDLGSLVSTAEIYDGDSWGHTL